MRLRNKLILLFLVTALIPVLCLGVVLSYSFQRTMYATLKNSLVALTALQVSRVNEAVENYRVKLHLVTSRTRLRQLIAGFPLKEDAGQAAEMTRILTDAAESSALHEVSVLNLQGKVIASTEPSEVGKNYSSKRLFLKGKETCSLEDIAQDGKGRLSVILSGPFLLEGKLIGVALIKDNAQAITEIAEDCTGLGETGETIIGKKDQNGDALFITPLRFDEKAVMKLRGSKEEKAVPMVRALKGENVFIESAPDYRGREVVAATHFIPGTGWGIVVKMDRAEALKPLWRVEAIIGAGILTLSGIIMLFTWFFSGRLTRPIIRLTDAAEGIRRGDLSQKIESSSRDEIGLLSGAFNEMADSLSSARKELNSRIGSLEKLEEELRRTGAYNRSLIEASLDPLVTINPEGQITDVNEATISVTGVRRQELVGTDFSIYFTEPEKAREGYRKVFEQGFVTDYPLTIRHRNGRLTDVLYNASVYRDESGNVLGVFAAARDITERKALEEELRRTGAYNRSLIEASLDPLVTISAEGKITDVNKATEEATGYNRAHLVGTDFSDYFTEPLKAQEGYRKVFKEGTVKDYPLEIRHRDGRTTPVLYNASVFRDERGSIKGVFAAARTLDAILRLSEKKLRDITHSLGEGIFVINKEEGLMFINPEAERILGWRAEELKGRNVHRLIHCNSGVDECPILGVLSSGEVCSTEDDTFLRKDGSRFPVSFIASPIWEDNRVTAVVTAFHDITERKVLEERLKEYTDELERSNRELERFAYVASHDLQEPLRRITSFTDLLEKKYKGRLDEKADSYIKFIRGGTSRMGVLINDLLTYSRLSTMAKPFTPTDCRAVVERVLADLSLLIEENNAQVICAALPVVTADDTQLRSLFQNLIGNALKFRGAETPVVHVSSAPVQEFLDRKPDLDPLVKEHLRELKKGLVFSVEDNGIGIAPSYHERIFQVFQRLHTEQEYPGTGIGLAICKKVVERHGGRIWVESAEGKGTTFSFSLPEK